MKEVYQENLLLLLEKNPELNLHLLGVRSSYQFLKQTQKYNLKINEKKLYSDDLDKEINDWFKEIDLENIDVLYVYGLGLGYHFDVLTKFLEDENKKLIFYEDDIEIIESFLKLESSNAILNKKNVYFSYEKQSQNHIEEFFLKGNPTVTAIDFYKKNKKEKFDSIKLKILEKTTKIQEDNLDRLYSHLHFANFLPNIKKVYDSFFVNELKDQFKDIPAVICGAGPSLTSHIDTLKNISDKAVIFAGGSAISALSINGVKPHFSVAIDPNRDEYRKLKTSNLFQTPLLYSTRINADVFNLFNSCTGYMSNSIGGLMEYWMEKHLNIDTDLICTNLPPFAMSVITFIIPLASFLGCNPIILYGMDLCYSNNKRYPDGVCGNNSIEDVKKQVNKKVGDRYLYKYNKSMKKEVLTNVRWIMEAKCIAEYKKILKDNLIINATTNGQDIEGVDRMLLSNVAQKYLTKSFDLDGLIHSLMQDSRFLFKKNENFSKKMKESISNCKNFIDQIVKILNKDSQNNISNIESKLIKEEAYIYLFYDLENILRKETKNNNIEKWQQIRSVLDKYLLVYSNSKS
jgi:hypothetical protein